MVDILGIINELPHNPSEALIELDWRLSKMAHLFPKPHKKSDIIYHVPLLLDNKKSYLKPAFDSNTYIDYLKANGKSRQKKPIPNYKPPFKLWDTFGFDKEWTHFTHEDVMNTIQDKDTSDQYGANFFILQSLIDLEPKLLDFLVDSYNRLMDHEICPEWSNCKIVPAHKGGDIGDISNFRPLTILPIVVRIWDSVISRKLSELLTNHGIVDTLVQRGVLRGVGGLSQNLYDVNRKMCSMRNDDICFFIDITNAYGSVNYGLMDYILREYNFSPNFTKYIKTYYMNAVASYDNKSFTWGNGLYQGSGLSNILFLIYMDYCLKNITIDLKMMRIIDFGFDFQNNMRAFVDDLVLFIPVSSYREIIKFIQMVFSFYGLQINQKKTYFFMNDATLVKLDVGDIKFNRVHIDFLYLGIGLICFREEFLNHLYSKIERYCSEIDSIEIDGQYKTYLYYRRVFQRINRILECYYVIFGRSAGLDEIMKLIGYFIYRWTGVFPSTYLEKHIEYIGNKGNQKLNWFMDSSNEPNEIDFGTLFGIENPCMEDIRDEMRAINTDPYFGF